MVNGYSSVSTYDTDSIKHTPYLMIHSETIAPSMAPSEEAKKANTHCYWFFYSMKLVPVLFICCIIGWSYYAYVIELCTYTVSSTAKSILFLIIYHGIMVMFLWSYYKTVFTKSGKVPDMFKLTESEYDRLMHAEDEEMQQTILRNYSKHLPTVNFTILGKVRYCEKCKIVKPDRAHHCSVCSQCILKMDHHCPWVNNCISYSNYKFFILFLAYGLVYCFFITLTTLEYFISFWKGDLSGTGKFHVLFMFFVALMFAISLLSLFAYHAHLLRHNRTTLEAFRPAVFQSGPDRNGFDLGTFCNFKEVFGEDIKKWFIPIQTSKGDGVVFSYTLRNCESEELMTELTATEDEYEEEE